MCKRHLRSASSESLIVLIQSCVRGYLTRRRLASSKSFARTARQAAVILQVNSLCNRHSKFTLYWLCAGSAVERIDTLHFLARCRKRRLNQALSVLSRSVEYF